MNVSQITAQAGDPNATLQGYGHVPVLVQTSKGNTRQVTGASFSGGGLALHTGQAAGTFTVRQVTDAVGASSADVAHAGPVEVTVRTAKGNPRRVTRAAYRGGSLVLVTSK